ncbi:LysR family transcriptional regulator [Legionella steigerwaltii]|uniref:LysR family transcriptional regulator n=1 Tax=Legionella steigerwaltii TaxID=460 RepID=A0A378LBL3_9GAMM|nr:LysR family transcriptional regulator [Legionella steigerwaltii]KTD75353.1 LysR family transcriptional regulator [Legionella steigerwaltii]STY23710.1 LysR family transcriptional regulator [Legionella steigerwaltii]
MNFYNNLESFVFAYELGSFSKAAKKLNITQSAVSLHIKQLENYLGEGLFERGSQSIIPTHAAKRLFTLIAEPFDKIRGVLDNFSKYTNSMRGEIQISCINEFAENLLIKSIGLCLEHEIKLKINYIPKDLEIINELQNNTIDFGVTSLKYDHPNLEFIKLFDDELVFIGTARWAKHIDKSSELAFNKSLKSMRWIGYEDTMPFIKRYVELALDISPNSIEPSLTFTDVNGIIRSVINGYGVACLPKFYLLPYLENKSIVQLHHPEVSPQYTLYLVYRTKSMLHKRMSFFKNLVIKSVS